jgi:transposase-like protein
MSMDDLARFGCPNPRCSAFGQRHAGNLSVHDRFGKQRQYRLLCCHTCQHTFSEHKGTVFFRAKLPHETIVAILRHLQEGCGVRATARLVGVHRDTVVRLARLAGTHAHEAHDECVAFSPCDPRGPVR